MLTKQTLFRARHLFRAMRISDCMKVGGVALAALMLLPGVSSRMSAQQGKPSQAKDEELGAVIKADVDVVSLYCTVHNKQNELVGNLTKTDFDLAEDGKQQTIKYFSRETDIPLTIGLLID